MSRSRSVLTRRSVLSLAVAPVAGTLPRLSASAGGNRSLVVIYLSGGNDANNMLVPLDDAPYMSYARARRELALGAGTLLPVKGLRSQGAYGFHPAMEELHRLYLQGQLAVVANVGSAARPVGHRYESSSFVRGGFLMPAWAGAGDILDDAAIGFDQTGVAVLPVEGGRAAGRNRQLREVLLRAQTPQLRTEFPGTGLGRALRHIAGMIQAGAGRHIFVTTLGGFDTHVDQLKPHGALLKQLSAAMGAFHDATLEMGVANRVTAVTDSEIGRSLYPNAAHGTDHGWGTHHLVMGAAVQGGDIHGEFPDFGSGTPADRFGALAPTTGRDRFEATLSGWIHNRVAVSSMGFLA